MLSPMTPIAATRSPCPPGACICEREQLLATPDTDLRIFSLTRQAEKVLLERLENIQSLSDLEHMQRRMHEQLGIEVQIDPKRRKRVVKGIVAIDTEAVEVQK